jgi:hypothetical protein
MLTPTRTNRTRAASNIARAAYCVQDHVCARL